MGDSVTIARRFRGPPGSGNGGYTCGLAALALGEGPAEVALRLPPPLETPLTIQRSPGRATLLVGDAVVAEARPAEVDVEVPDAVSFEQAEAAAHRFAIEPYAAAHAFPGCFVCGPERAAGDGLRIFPAPLEPGVPRVVWPWVPDASLAADDGLVDPALLWAALDCPSGLAWLEAGGALEPAVLGRLAVRIDRRPAVGERLIVAGWAIGREGRKQLSGSALWSSDGALLALARATWIVLTEAQARAFGIPPAKGA